MTGFCNTFGDLRNVGTVKWLPVIAGGLEEMIHISFPSLRTAVRH